MDLNSLLYEYIKLVLKIHAQKSYIRILNGQSTEPQMAYRNPQWHILKSHGVNEKR